jgi:acyl carrier protein
MTDHKAILKELSAGFAEIFRIDAPTAETDLIDEGILDSFQFVELLVFLDQRFGLKVQLDDVDLDDLRTLNRLASLVARERDAVQA